MLIIISIVLFIILIYTFFIFDNSKKTTKTFTDKKYIFKEPIEIFSNSNLISIEKNKLGTIIKPQIDNFYNGFTETEYASLFNDFEKEKNLTIVDDLHSYLFEPADIQFYTERTNRIPINLNELWEHPQIEDNNFVDPDSQNIHDSFVQRITKQTAKEQLVSVPSNINIFLEINEHLHENPHKNEILTVLDKIRTRNSVILNLDSTEIKILEQVWEKAKNNENIKNQLFIELNDCLENDEVVCATGTVSRMINALNINNPDMMPKTKEFLRIEMLQTASNIYSDIGETCPNYKEIIVETLYENYRDILTKEELKTEMSEWIDYI
jgi:hypothetical protein